MANTKRRKTGPRPMPKRDRRSLKLGVPLNQAELAAIRRAAGTGSVAAWARDVLMEAATKGAR